jgi:hypothetical protein
MNGNHTVASQETLWQERAWFSFAGENQGLNGVWYQKARKSEGMGLL